jgi:hypothetical protein
MGQFALKKINIFKAIKVFHRPKATYPFPNALET